MTSKNYEEEYSLQERHLKVAQQLSEEANKREQAEEEKLDEIKFKYAVEKGLFKSIEWDFDGGPRLEAKLSVELADLYKADYHCGFDIPGASLHFCDWEMSLHFDLADYIQEHGIRVDTFDECCRRVREFSKKYGLRLSMSFIDEKIERNRRLFLGYEESIENFTKFKTLVEEINGSEE